MFTGTLLYDLVQRNSLHDYPLAPRISTLPYPIIIGAEIGVPYSMVEQSDYELKYTVYVRNVCITTNDIEVIIAASTNNGASEDIGRCYTTYASIRGDKSSLPATNAGAIRLEIAPLNVTNNDLEGVSGSIYLGPIDHILTYTQNYILSPQEGAFDISCIHPYPNTFSAFIVDGQRKTGDIVLEAGDGVGISVTEEGNILFSINPDASTEGINSREELIDEVVRHYGYPIHTINDIYPDKDGNFVIAADEKSCSAINELSNGIQLINPCATTCCDRTHLDQIMEDINELNSRSARITEYLTSVSTNLNSLSNELAMLKLGLKQQ